MTFTCDRCHQTKSQLLGPTTGYGTDADGRKICFICCGSLDHKSMLETGRMTLYYSDKPHPKVSNWPGTLVFIPSHVKLGHHNMCGKVRVVYFRGPNDEPWSGRVVGDETMLLHCKRITETSWKRSVTGL